MAPRVSLGNLETIVIVVRVARHCITESRESFHLDAALFSQQSLSVALCKVGKPGMAPTEVKMMAILHIYNGKDVLVWLLMARASPLLSSYHSYSASVNFAKAEVT